MITSTSNSTVKAIRSLRDRKCRERTGRFFAEGTRIVGEALALPTCIDFCVLAPELLVGEFALTLQQMIRDLSVACIEVSADVFKSLSTRDGPQGIGAVIFQRWAELHDLHPEGDLCWVALDAVQDPGNVGAILRTCDAVGAAGVILVGPTTDPHDTSAVRGSMGAIFSQRLVRTDRDKLFVWAREHGCTLVGTSDRASLDYTAIEYRPPIVLFMGSEREGLSADDLTSCDTSVKIPMVGRSDSLNLAIATGVILYEVFNQQRRKELNGSWLKPTTGPLQVERK
ncbi:MAG: RNA methyltransferase [Chloroflexota bacterium]